MSSVEKFGDVEPISLEENEDGACVINYPPQYRELMDIFRAVFRSGERSERVLELTADIIEWNAAHYTVWVVRRDVLHSLAQSSELYEIELEYSESVAMSNPKNYQVWYHRREILLKLNTKAYARLELEFIERMLEDDRKNYHAWSHRLWVLKHYNVWDQELDFTQALVDNDAWNNSAWNHRHSVIFRDPALSASLALQEIQFAFSYIHKAGLRNESPYTYALSFARSHYAMCAHALDTALSKILQDSNLQPEDKACARMTKLELLVHADTSDSLDQAAKHANILATSEDSFRVRYWTRREWSISNRAKRHRGEATTPFPGMPPPSPLPWAPEGWFPFGYPPNLPFAPFDGNIPDPVTQETDIPQPVPPPAP